MVVMRRGVVVPDDEDEESDAILIGLMGGLVWFGWCVSLKSVCGGED